MPIPAIESRHGSATIFSFHGRRKEVIKLLLTFSRAGRAYIIEENGLPGLLLDKHINRMSWMYEFRLSPDNMRTEEMKRQLKESEWKECEKKLA